MWTSFCCNNHTFYLNKRLENGIISVLLTDLVKLWKEDLSADLAVKRFEEDNNEKGTKERIIQYILEDLDPVKPGVTTFLEERDSHVDLKIRGVQRCCSYSMLQCSPEQFSKEVTLPLLLIIQELQRRQEKLKELLAAKDTEITEYRLEGGKLFRKYLKTKKFDNEAFLDVCEKDVEANLINDLGNVPAAFSSEVNKLYLSAVRVSENCDSIAQGFKLKEENVETSDTSKPKTMKWELEPKEVKRFKRNNPKIKL